MSNNAMNEWGFICVDTFVGIGKTAQDNLLKE